MTQVAEYDSIAVETKILAHELVGMEADQAERLVLEAGREWHVVPSEGRVFLHGDLRPLRILVHVHDGKVIWSRGG